MFFRWNKFARVTIRYQYMCITALNPLRINKCGHVRKSCLFPAQLTSDQLWHMNAVEKWNDAFYVAIKCSRKTQFRICCCPRKWCVTLHRNILQYIRFKNNHWKFVENVLILPIDWKKVTLLLSSSCMSSLSHIHAHILLSSITRTVLLCMQ